MHGTGPSSYDLTRHKEKNNEQQLQWAGFKHRTHSQSTHSAPHITTSNTYQLVSRTNDQKGRSAQPPAVRHLETHCTERIGMNELAELTEFILLFFPNRSCSSDEMEWHELYFIVYHVDKWPGSWICVCVKIYEGTGS